MMIFKMNKEGGNIVNYFIDGYSATCLIFSFIFAV